jgi:hypothetical protein
MFWQYLLKYAPSALLALTPLLTAEYSLLDILGQDPDRDGKIALSFYFFKVAGTKPEVEMEIRLVATLCGIALLTVSGFQDFFPAKTLVTFRQDFLDHLCQQEWRKKRGRIPDDVRINVMFKHWRARWFFLGPSLSVVWRDRFEPRHKDAAIKLYIWQGVCGQAVRHRQTAFVDLGDERAPLGFREKWLYRNQFHLSAWQLRKTRKIRAIMSIPIFTKVGPKGKEKDRCVGVINLDTETDTGATFLANKSGALSEAFAKYGTLIAKLR